MGGENVPGSHLERHLDPLPQNLEEFSCEIISRNSNPRVIFRDQFALQFARELSLASSHPAIIAVPLPQHPTKTHVRFDEFDNWFDSIDNTIRVHDGPLW